jgi:predicted amidohydrolase YtcJ
MKTSKLLGVMIFFSIIACGIFQSGIPADPTGEMENDPTTTSPPTAPVISGPADIIFHNGVVLTMETTAPQGQALAIQGEKILAVGSDAEVMTARGPQTQVIDLAGRTLMPGFIDGHSHFLAFYGRQGGTFDQAIQTALALGITGLTEQKADESLLDLLFQAEKDGRLRLRVNAFPQYNDSQLNSAGSSSIMQVWYPANGPIFDADKRLRIPGVKIFVDGDYSPARGCWALTDPLPEEAQADFAFCGNEWGDVYWTQEELNLVVASIQGAGFRASFHSMGDRAIKMTLNAIEYALAGDSNELHRHQIQHNSLLPTDQLQRYVDLGIVASVRGNFGTCEQDWIYLFGPERLDWVSNRYALPGLGVHAFVEMDWAWPSDPFDPYTAKNANPFVHLYGLVTRQQAQEDGTVCMPDPTLAKHSISVAKALEMFTLEPAYAVSQENVLGSLRPGKYADVIILSDNPLTMDPNDLWKTKVLMTMVGGNVEYCAGGNPALCSSDSETESTGTSPTEVATPPVSVSILEKEFSVVLDTPLVLTLGWETQTAQQVADFLAAAQLEISLDGEPLKNTSDYWGEIEPSGDHYVSQLLYPVSALSPGSHQVDVKLSVTNPVTDGLGNTYSGIILQNTLRIEAGN